jgi:dTDP-glucose 4,6-dehydratase
MKYLLLGGAGVFALHTAKFLLEQKETELVVCVGRNTVKNPAFNLNIGNNDKRYVFKPCHIVYEQDFLFEYLEEYKPDFVINFAALAYATSWDKSFRYYDTNVTAVSKICEFLSNKSYLKKFLQIGTSELYGPVSEPVDENYPINPTSPYSISKLAADMHLETMFKVRKFPMNIIRPSNGYGSGQLLYRIVPKSAYLILKGEKFPLEGGGRVKKSFMHCRDIARAIYMILHKGKMGEIYNAGVDQPISMREIVEKVAKCLDRNFDDVVNITEGRLGEDAQYWLSSKKLFNDTGWKPEISIDEGIKETVDWVKNNMNNFKNENLEFQLRA